MGLTSHCPSLWDVVLARIGYIGNLQKKVLLPRHLGLLEVSRPLQPLVAFLSSTSHFVHLHRPRMDKFPEGKWALQKVSLLSFWNSTPLSPGCVSSSPVHSDWHWAATSYYYFIIQSRGAITDGS